jgi:hypothetical protein
MQTDAAQTRELLAGETHLAHQAMRALRTTYESEQEFVEHVDGVLRPAGYRLLGAFSPDHEPAGAVAGFRVGDNPSSMAHEPRPVLLMLIAGRSPEGHRARLVVGDDRGKPDRASLAQATFALPEQHRREPLAPMLR